MYSDKFLQKYFYILDAIKPICKDSFTQGELAVILKSNRITINQFLNKKIVRVDLLEQVSALCGYDLMLDYQLIHLQKEK